jgi:prevent-host-death family protein
VVKQASSLETAVNTSKPTTRVVAATDVAQRFADLLDGVTSGQTRVVIERGGAPVAALISAEDLRRFRWMDAERAERFRALDEMQAAFRDAPDAEVEREIERAVADVRAKQRHQVPTATRSA